MPKCAVCTHVDRADIENAILSMTSSKDSMTLESISERFEVPLEDLKMHAVFHTPLVSEEDLESAPLYSTALDQPRDESELLGEPAEPMKPKSSLARQMRLRETDMLTEVSNEYMVTLKSMGRRLNRLIAVQEVLGEDDDQALRLSKLLTRPMVDLYIGLGGEIRANVKAVADIERAINGPKDSTSTGLLALAEAIKGSGSE